MELDTNPTKTRCDQRELTPSGQPAIRGRQAVSLVAVLLVGVLSYQLNASMVTPALPSMAKSLGVGSDSIAQVSSLFFLAGSVAGLVLARWGDFLGRRRALIVVLCTLVAGTLICLFAPSLPVLLAGRVIQGSSSAAFQLTYVILSESMSVRTFGVTLGIITAINGGVGGIDGYLGGMLTEHFTYRSIFVVVLAVAVIGLIGTMRVVPKGGRPPGVEGSMDWSGAAAMSVALIALTYFVSEGSSRGWADPLTLALAAGTIVAFAVFVLIERRAATPLIAVRHLRSRQVWPVVATTLLALSGIFAVINFSVVMLSQGSAPGYSMTASHSALLYLMPPAMIGVAAAPAAGWLAGRIGWRRVQRIGLLSSLAILAVIAAMAFNPYLVCAMIALLGVTYNGLVLTATNGLGVLLSPKEAPAALPGLNGAAFGLGASLGIGLVAPFVAQATKAGYTTGLWISVGITLGAALTSFAVAGRQNKGV
jgi:predicted MFS family arabinose efflux permease